MNMQKVKNTQVLLRYAYGIAVLVIGLDKVLQTHWIVNWSKYVNDIVTGVLPAGSMGIFLTVIGVVEVVVAILILYPKTTRIGAYISAVWLLLIALNLVLLGYLDIAARDVLLAVGAVSLAWLTEATSDREG